MMQSRRLLGPTGRKIGLGSFDVVNGKSFESEVLGFKGFYFKFQVRIKL